MKTVDVILKNATQIVTCANESRPKRGKQMLDAGIIKNGAIAINEGKIAAIGETSSILSDYHSENTFDATGKSIIPGLIDCHTHVPYAGNRYDEFEMRVQGKSYMEIMNAGGGILSTVRATRSASLEQLITLAQSRLMNMMQLGTTTAELKTGYGLSVEAEAKQMQAILTLAESHPMTIVPTFLGAHTKAPEFNSVDDYLESILSESLSHVEALIQAKEMVMFVDIFVEEGVFTVEHMKRYFEVAQKHGLPLKAHLDQFEHLGAVPIAIEMGAVSVDHLEVTPKSDLNILANSDTVGVMLPTVNFNLGICQFGNARHLIDSDGILALATDYNPGSSPTISMPLVMAIACRFQKLLPAEALNACTINAAAALNIQDKVGSLETGKQADFLILDTDDYRAIVVEFGRNFVEEVYINGRQVWKTSS